MPEVAKRPLIRQSSIPSVSLEAAVRVPQAIVDQFGGRPTAPNRVADAVGMTQTSSSWRSLSGAATAYGLTDGGYNSKQIGVADLGRRIVAPQSEGDDITARAEAAVLPSVLRAFMERYEGSNFPEKRFGINVLVDLGVPRARAADVFDLIEANGRYAGILQPTRTGRLFVTLNDPAAPDERDVEADGDAQADAPVPPLPETTAMAGINTPANNRVFITHGKNKIVVDQLKKLITYGRLVPVVAQERETTSIPVPSKVFDEMRKCFAGIIHVAVDEVITDADGQEHPRINENVLIELGAAMALYGKNVILLSQDGLQLPSNLQGLYLCKYSGDGLDHDSTMRLLEALSRFAPA